MKICDGAKERDASSWPAQLRPGTPGTITTGFSGAADGEAGGSVGGVEGNVEVSLWESREKLW